MPGQSVFYEDLMSKIIMLSAGLGGGKTHVLCRKMLQLSALNAGHPGGLLCPTFKDFRRDVKPEMQKILEDEMGLREKKHYWFNKSYAEYTFIWNKKPLYILTGEQPIAGPNLAYCGINEFSLIRFERIKEMLRRVRLKEAPYLQRCLAGTPEDIHAWLEDFVEMQEKLNETDPNAFNLIYADTRENIHIDPEYRAHLESMLDEQALKVFASGMIVRLGGDYFYYSFSRPKNVKPCQHDPEKIVHVGLDFNVGKMAASFNHVYNDRLKGKKIETFGELLLEGDSDTPKMGKAILERFPKERIVITCDSSGKNRQRTGVSDVQALLDLGFHKEQVRYKRSNPRLRERQLLINGIFAKERYSVDPSCRRVIKDFEKVQQSKIDYTKIKDKDDKLTHFSDGLDYLFDFEYNFDLRKSRTRQL